MNLIMPRLLINPDSPTQWEIQLKPGTNLLGRGFANDLVNLFLALDSSSDDGSFWRDRFAIATFGFDEFFNRVRNLGRYAS